MENEANSSLPKQELPSHSSQSPQDSEEPELNNNNNNQSEMPSEEHKKLYVRPLNFHLPPPSPEVETRNMEDGNSLKHPSSDPTSLFKHRNLYDSTPQTLKVRKLGKSFSSSVTTSHEDMDVPAASSPYSSPIIPKHTPRSKFPSQAHTLESHSLPQTPLYHPPQQSIATPNTLTASLSTINSPPAGPGSYTPSPSIVVTHPISHSAPVTPYKSGMEANLPKPDQSLWENRYDFSLKIKRENFSSVPSSPSKPRATPAKRKLIAQSPDVRDFNISMAKNIKYFSENPTTTISPMEGTEQPSNPNNFGESPQKARFETVRRLGTGTEAEVYEVIDKKNSKKYALKIARKPGTLKSAEHESRIGTGMQHPHCVKYFTSWSEDNCVHIILELCTKGSLDMQPPPSQQDLWRYMNEMAQGLDYMHNTKQLVHLDIKPSNVMVSESGELRIGDFGTAVEVGSNLNSYSHLDFQYIAPDLTDPGPSKSVQVFPAADVFSFGLVLFELATNIKMPQKNQEQEVELWNKIRNHDSMLATTLEKNNIPPTSLLGSTILRMLDPNPETRITIQELIDISQAQLNNVTNNNNH